MQQYACRLAKWRAGNVLDILQRGMYISNPGLQHSELAHRGGRLCLSLTHSLTHSIHQSLHSFIGLGTNWGPTDKVCVASMPDCILWHNHMRRLLCATCMCSIATLIKQLFSHSSFNLSGLLHWLRCNEQWPYSLAACTCCSQRRCCTYKQTSKVHECSVLVLDTG